MDNYKTLFEKQQYSLIKDLLKDSMKEEEVFIYVNSLIQLGEYNEAIKTIRNKLSILWAYNPSKILDLNFELRFMLKQFDEAYEDLDEFNQFLYVSQEVEEKLKEYKTKIRTTERDYLLKKDNYSPSSIKDILLNEKDDGEVLSVLDYVKSHNVNDYVEEIKSIVETENRHPFVKTYALLLLVYCNYDKQISLKKEDQINILVPKQLKHPFESDKFFSIKKIASSKCKNVSILQAFDTIIGSYQMSIYPKLVEDENIELLASAVLSISSLYLNDPIERNTLLSSSFTLDDLNKKITEIEKLQNEAPPIKI